TLAVTSHLYHLLESDHDQARAFDRLKENFGALRKSAAGQKDCTLSHLRRGLAGSIGDSDEATFRRVSAPHLAWGPRRPLGSAGKSGARVASLASRAGFEPARATQSQVMTRGRGPTRQDLGPPQRRWTLDPAEFLQPPYKGGDPLA